MGMFDDIKIEYPLPEGVPTEMQTKSIHCTMAQYRISQDGKLQKAKFKSVKRPKKEVEAEYQEYLKLEKEAKEKNPTYKPFWPVKRRTTKQVIDKWITDATFSGLVEAYTNDKTHWYDVSFLIDDGEVVKFKGCVRKPL